MSPAKAKKATTAPTDLTPHYGIILSPVYH